MRHIHLIGIGGTGLSAIARVLIERGFHVSGSDLVASPLFKAITTAGAKTSWVIGLNKLQALIL